MLLITDLQVRLIAVEGVLIHPLNSENPCCTQGKSGLWRAAPSPPAEAIA
jgi:hypothetical protein